MHVFFKHKIQPLNDITSFNTNRMQNEIAVNIYISWVQLMGASLQFFQYSVQRLPLSIQNYNLLRQIFVNKITALVKMSGSNCFQNHFAETKLPRLWHSWCSFFSSHYYGLYQYIFIMVQCSI